MISYVHCHIGQHPPDYLLDSFESIYSVDPEARLILITDQDIEIDGIEILQVTEISSDQTKEVMNMKLFSDDSNPLWRTAIFRIFLVRDAIQYLGLNYCYHFDSDVLMFQSSKTFEHLVSDFDGLYITPCNSDELVFGFSRFGKLEKINQICGILFDIVFDEGKQKKYSAEMPNEMQLLCGIFKERPDLIKKLITLPFNNEKLVFDPSSYGQYFGGTHQGHGPGWYGNHHDIGAEIGRGNIKPIMIDKKPFVEYNDKKYPIVNLHIHSKKTKQFIEENTVSEIDLNIENRFIGVEMLPFERMKLYTWVSEIVKPTNAIDLGCGCGGGTYYISKGMKKCGSKGKVYSCDPGRGPSSEFLSEQDNVDYRKVYSNELISDLISDCIKIDYLFFDGPEDPDVAIEDIKVLEEYIQPGCYFSMHDWEIEKRMFDNAISIKAAKIRPYMESNPLWEEIEVLDGVTKSDSVGLCLYKFLGK